MASETGSAVPPQAKGSWTSFLKSIASFNGDLSTLTAPAFILSTKSLTEFSTYWTEHPSIFVAPTQEPDPAKRALLVLKWFLSTLKQQYSSRSDKLGSEKKPLNPFLGELFLGGWKDDAGETELISEQVSHHPPVTAYCIRNAKHGIQLEGYNAQKASFSRTIHVKQIGHALLSFTPPNSTTKEFYLITLPALHIESLISGSPYVELEKQTHIVSSTGYTATVDYSGRGWLSGKKNTFTGALWKAGSGDAKNPLYSVTGQWNDSFVFSLHEGSHSKKGTEVDSYHVAPTTPLQVPDVENMDPFESRRAWRHVAAAIVKGNMDSTGAHKSRIENAQRDLRKREQGEGKDWPRVFFTRSTEKDQDAGFADLVKLLGASWGLEADKTGGVWRFDAEKAKTAQKPFHKDLETAGWGLGDDGK